MKKSIISFWDNYGREEYKAIENNESTDVLIIGGGIVGLTCAALLQAAGHKCILVDRNKVGGITSTRTTAKITSQHSLTYHNLIKHQGIEKAKMYLESNEKAIKDIENLLDVYKIQCDFNTLSNYVFAQDKSSTENIKKEIKAVQSLGFRATYLDKVNIPIENYGGIEFANQAQFNPVKYMNSLAKLFLSNNGVIYENSLAKNIDSEININIAYFNNNSFISARHIIIATQFPFYDGLGLYFTRLFGERSYVTAIKTNDPLEKGMYISCEEPTISLRTYTDGKDNYTLVGGENHKVGAKISTSKCYNNLPKRAHEMFDVQEKIISWSAQDYNTVDSIPYIGRLTKNYSNLYVATGFGKWGMTNSMISAQLIKDLIEDKPNPYVALYNPSRLRMEADSAKTFIIENARVAKELITGKLKKSEDGIYLEKEQGKVINYNKKRYGAYRDINDKIYVVDNTCTHLGCELVFNDAEKSWDCPCHSSRFSYDGSIIEGVAKKALERYEKIAEVILNKDDSK